MLIHRVGPGAATRLLLSGEQISAADAHQIGLCHGVVSADKLDARERELAPSILTGAPSALAMTKQLLIENVWLVLSKQLEAGMRVSAQAGETTDAREGLAEFLEKRAPNWFS